MRTRTIAASLLFGAAIGVGGWWMGKDQSASPPLQAVRSPEEGARLFEQVYQLIAMQYVDSLPVDSLYRKAVAGFVSELDDPYSTFLPEVRSRRLQEQLAGNYSGIGINLDLRDGWMTVVEPFPGAAAERAGLQAGDRITEVAGESTRGLTTEEVVRLLRGTPGSSVALTIVRFGVHRFAVSVARESVQRPTVPRVVMLQNRVGYIDVNVFGTNTATELRQALDSLNHMGAQAVVLDLRGNPGGLLEQGVAVAELFLDPSSRIVELRGRPAAEPERIIAQEPQWWPKLAVAVLVDQNSASASEIVAGALQDNDRAIVVGHTSLGKGSAQTVYPMSTGGALRITTARWFTPLGRRITPALDTVQRGDEFVPVLSTAPRPRFTTPMGRTVLGGGGIVPDVVAGDSLLPLSMQRFAIAVGPAAKSYRDAVAQVALTFKQRGTLATPLQPVTREMVNAVWEDIRRRGIAVDREIFDAAAPWIARALGYEITRVSFGPEAEFLRRAKDDEMITRAVRLLDGAASPQDPFARAADPSVVVPMRTPAFDE